MYFSFPSPWIFSRSLASGMLRLLVIMYFDILLKQEGKSNANEPVPAVGSPGTLHSVIPELTRLYTFHNYVDGTHVVRMTIEKSYTS